jgi:beta-galactosidase/beta-glucuronidase
MTNEGKTTDAFLQIAQRAETAREGLIEPPPLPMRFEKRYELEAGVKPVCLPPTPRDKAWFASELARLREVWAPFLERQAPVLESIRERTELTRFDWRLDNTARPERLPEAMAGQGDWESVSVPHYGPPMGRATAFYRRVFEFDSLPGGKRLWLHFEGVDYIAKVYLNGNYIGQHEGIVGPFEMDVTDYVVADRKNVLLVQVENDAIMMGNDSWDLPEAGDKLYAATGPGWDEPHTGWHHCPPGMGIYRKVYLEVRPEVFIEDAWVRPLVDESAVELWLEVHSHRACVDLLQAHIAVFGRNFEEVVLPETAIPLNGVAGVGRNYYRVHLAVPDSRLWNPDHPWLHVAQVKVGEDTHEVVFGMRDFRMETETEPKGRLYLNGEPVPASGRQYDGTRTALCHRGRP